MTCSICEADNTKTYCEHRAGEEYDGKTCYKALDDPKDAYEISFVAVPAQPEAGVTKDYGGKKGSSSAADAHEEIASNFCRQRIKMEVSDMPKSSDFTRDDFRKKFSDALKTNDEEKVAEVFCSFAEEMRKGIENDYLEYQKTKDNAILEKRGVRTLTADETKFYKALIKAAREDSIEKGFEGLENAFPETVIDQVLDDIKTIFPLLGAISIQNTATLTKMIVNKKGVQFAVWGPLGSKITQELDGAIAKVEVGTKKLTAFMVISKDMMDAGPQWIDAYVRAVLAEALGAGLCKAIIAGTGKNEPIGMMKNPDGSVTEGVYPDKEAVKITDLSPKTIGSIAKTISKGPNNRKRAVPEAADGGKSDRLF